MKESLEKYFVFTSEDENDRRKYDFTFVRTALKKTGFSFVGVKVWKSCKNKILFKKKYLYRQNLRNVLVCC